MNNKFFDDWVGISKDMWINLKDVRFVLPHPLKSGKTALNIGLANQTAMGNKEGEVFLGEVTMSMRIKSGNAPYFLKRWERYMREVEDRGKGSVGGASKAPDEGEDNEDFG